MCQGGTLSGSWSSRSHWPRPPDRATTCKRQPQISHTQVCLETETMPDKIGRLEAVLTARGRRKSLHAALGQRCARSSDGRRKVLKGA
jgi:hypothetical protein